MGTDPDFSEDVKASWLHVVPLRNGLLRLRIENLESEIFTPWLDLMYEDFTRYIFPLVGGRKEIVDISGGLEEYLVRVDDEEALKAMLYPKGE